MFVLRHALTPICVEAYIKVGKDEDRKPILRQYRGILIFGILICSWRTA